MRPLRGGARVSQLLMQSRFLLFTPLLLLLLLPLLLPPLFRFLLLLLQREAPCWGTVSLRRRWWR